MARMSRPTDCAPVSRSRAWIARETSSRGSSSSTNRSPELSCSVAPSPRIASVTRNPSRPGTPVTAVGWNWTSSRSASSAPAACASSSPVPCEPGGLVVRSHIAAAPPVAITTPRLARIAPPSHTTPTQRSGTCHSASARACSRIVTRASATARADSWRTTRLPVALPPACTTRLTEWPPSRPSARRPKRSASKRTPQDSRSRTQSGASRARISAAERLTRPRPARSVSSRCSSGRSSAASAAANPPCAQ